MNAWRLFYVLVFASQLSAQNTELAPEEEVRRISAAYSQAVVEGNVEAYEILVSDDYIHTGSNGGVVGKAEMMAEMKADVSDIEIEYGRSEDEKIRIYGNTAIATGRWVMKGKFRGEAFEERERYTTVFVKGPDGWKIVAEQTTQIGSQELAD